MRVDIVASLRYVGLLLRKDVGIEGFFSLLTEEAWTNIKEQGRIENTFLFSIFLYLHGSIAA